MLFNGNLRYDYFVPTDEKFVKSAIRRYAKEIFGEETVYIDLKTKTNSKSGIAQIPDGYVISLKEPTWCIVSIELSCREDFYKYATARLNRFYSVIEASAIQEELVAALFKSIENGPVIDGLKNIGSTNLQEYLRLLISKPPQTVVVTDGIGERVSQICGGLKNEPSVVRFKMFVAENTKKPPFYLFEQFSIEKFSWRCHGRGASLGNRPKSNEIVPIVEYEKPVLESIIELGGSAKARDVLEKVHDKMKSRMTERDYEMLPAGGIRWEKLVQWARFDLKLRGFIDKSAPFGTWKITPSGKEYFESLNPKPVEEIRKPFK